MYQIMKTEKRHSSRNGVSLYLSICFPLAIQLLFLFILDAKAQVKQNINLTKELEVGLPDGDENYVFGLIADAKIDNLGNIYILDIKLNTVSKFSRDGKFILRFGNKGSGPGEFEHPQTILLDPLNQIYILDARKVIIFNDKGNFIRSFPLDFRGIDIAINEKGNLLVLGVRNDQIINVYNHDGKYLYSFANIIKNTEEYSKNKNNQLFHTPLRVWTNGNRIFLMNPYKYEILIYKNDKLIRRLTRNSADYLKPEIKESSSGSNVVVSGNYIYENNSFIIVYYNGNKASWLDIYENEKYIMSTQVKGTLFSIDSNGKLYFIENDEYPRVIRYSKIPILQ